MSSAVLVLDIDFQPLRFCSWQEAIASFFGGKVEVVEYSRDRTIRGVERTWPMPSVVRVLRRFNRNRMRIKFSRINIYTRDHFTCAYCGERKETEFLTFDHVLPKSQGGRTNWENIVTACYDCNMAKGNRTPEVARMTLLIKPKKPHFLPAVTVAMTSGTPPEWANYWFAPLDNGEARIVLKEQLAPVSMKTHHGKNKKHNK